VLIWVITTFPIQDDGDEAASLERSIAGSIGRVIEPVFRPLGFGWKMSVATITGFAAKEVVVSTLGILYRAGGGNGANVNGESAEIDENSESLRAALRADPDMSPLKGFTLMLFMLLIPPCFAALATIRAELGWAWLAFEFVFLLATGWALAFIVFQVGSLA
jgi:ferrous iron transport protein B